MVIGSVDDLTSRFLVPRSPAHRQYEALRAFFVDHRPSAVVAERFGYSPGSFRVLCHEFRRHPDREFFRSPSRGPKSSPKKDRVRDQIVTLRKQNFSIYDIRRALLVPPAAAASIRATEWAGSGLRIL